MREFDKCNEFPGEPKSGNLIHSVLCEPLTAILHLALSVQLVLLQQEVPLRRKDKSNLFIQILSQVMFTVNSLSA
jgi:hypothetical protein